MLAEALQPGRALDRRRRDHQRPRIVPTPYSLYHDRSSDPDTLSVEAVGRGNLLALATAGYDGPSASEIRTAAEAGTRFSLLLQDPSGQAPVNGRTDDHVWVDVGYQLAFEVNGIILAANTSFVLRQDPRALELARRVVRRRLRIPASG